MHTKSGRKVTIAVIIPALKERGAGKHLAPSCEDKAEYWAECALDPETSPKRRHKAVLQLRALTPKVSPELAPHIEEVLRRVERMEDGRQED